MDTDGTQDARGHRGPGAAPGRATDHAAAAAAQRPPPSALRRPVRSRPARRLPRTRPRHRALAARLAAHPARRRGARASGRTDTWPGRPRNRTAPPCGSWSAGAVISAARRAAVWSLLWNGYLGSFWLWPLYCSPPTPGGSARPPRSPPRTSTTRLVAARAGRRLRPPRPLARTDQARPRAGTRRRTARPRAAAAAPEPEDDLAEWPELRAAGARRRRRAARRRGAGRADERRRLRPDPPRLALRARRTRTRLAAFTDAVRRHGAGACVHPSGRARPAGPRGPARPARRARSGSAPSRTAQRNPYARRGTGLALDPALLGTSLLAVGPPGAGKTTRARPARGRVAVRCRRSPGRPPSSPSAPPAPGSAPTTPSTSWSGSATRRPCTTSTCTAVPRTPTRPPPSSPRGSSATSPSTDSTARHDRARPAARPLPGRARPLPLRARAARAARRDARGRWPRCARPSTTAASTRMLRELDARERQHGAPGDPGRAARRPRRPARPARLRRLLRHHAAGPARSRCAPWTTRCGSVSTCPSAGTRRPPGCWRGWSSPSSRRARRSAADRSLFACLVLDDATHTLTAETLRGVQRLRSANAGAVLTLRTPRRRAGGAARGAARRGRLPDGVLRDHHLGRQALRRGLGQGVGGDPGRHAAHGLRRPAADQGHPRPSQAGHGQGGHHRRGDRTQVERERWSASELAHAVPAGARGAVAYGRWAASTRRRCWWICGADGPRAPGR